ncbi:MAG: hypothetical protein GYB68_04635 [Chloroflexi bacterium]|nr:hypothetical protein [Chloroflexota bacterium]
MTFELRLGSIVSAICLLIIAGWLIASSLISTLPGFEMTWPVFLFVVGLGMVAFYGTSEADADGLLFTGTILLLLGLYFSLFSFSIGGLTWDRFDGYWPGFPLIVGAACLILYIAKDMQPPSLLIPTYLLGGIGLIAFPITLGIVTRPSIVHVVEFWPLAALLLAIAFFTRSRPEADEA